MNRKAGGGAQITTYTPVGSGTVFGYPDDLRPLSWTGGAPTASSSNNFNGVYNSGIGNGFTFTAPADTTVRTLTVHAGGWLSGGTLKACLSDGSAATYTDVTPAVTGQFDRNYTLTYRASSPGQMLRVIWTMTSGEDFRQCNAQRGGAEWLVRNCDCDGGNTTKHRDQHGLRDGTEGDRAGWERQSRGWRDGNVYDTSQRRQCTLRKSEHRKRNHRQQRRGDRTGFDGQHHRRRLYGNNQCRRHPCRGQLQSEQRRRISCNGNRHSGNTAKRA